MDYKRYQEVEVFRGLAILSVLLFHYTTRYNQIYSHYRMLFEFPYGHLGVYFFYIISGYVVYMSAQSTNAWPDFIIKRFSKLYPAYWISIVFTFIVVYIFGLPGRQVSLHDALINFTMLQDWFDGVKSVDGAYWTLSRFFSFYFIMFLILLFNLKQRMVEVCSFWLLLIFVYIFAASKGIKVPGKLSLLLLLREGCFFIIGIMCRMIKKDGDKSSFYIVILACLLSIFSINGKIIFVAAVTFTLSFVSFIKGYLAFIKIRFFIWLGSISYSLYLIHQNIGYIILNTLKPLNLNFIILILIPTLVSIFIAAVVTHLIERPALSLIRSVVQSNSAKSLVR